ncbi:hypothetical protein GMLC_14900 [Geomonas limicola]|uniref:Uncharacterized protein n=1 Tax=Geomonas limicola TaxID=2740186 RepID=A0A6V8N617_9BACT|nr:hypothetical protein [Geomonas limicola]GFO67911.1 hypothetical protein GMLC_14900 [Geomonas limicola]
MDAKLSQLEPQESAFFRRIDRDLERSRELRRDLHALLIDVRRANQRQPRNDDALS